MFFESFFNDDPTFSLADAEEVIWDNYPDDFRDYWGLDSHSPPEGMERDEWLEYRQLAQLVAKLASGASTLVRPKSTREDQLTQFSWLTEEAAASDQSWKDLLDQWRSKLPSDVWWKLYSLTRPFKPDDPRVKKAFMHNCMQLEAARLFPDHPARLADRLFQLTAYFVRKPGQRVREYLPRVAECFVRGMDIELAVMARAVLDAALQDAFNDDEVGKTVGAGKDVTLERRIEYAVAKDYFDRDDYAAAARLREEGNMAAHAELKLTVHPEQTLALLAECLEALDNS